MTDFLSLFSSSLLFVIAYLLLFLGMVGAVVPVLPGPLLIWLGAFLWAWADGFLHVGWPTLLVLAALTVVSWAADLGLSFFSSRKSGAGWSSIGVSTAGGLLGAILLSGVPVIGTFIGAAIGSISALWLMEFRRAQASATVEGSAVLRRSQHSKAAATNAVKGYVGGFLLSIVIQFGVSTVMLAIFAWQAFL